MAEGGEPYENIPLDILNEYDEHLREVDPFYTSSAALASTPGAPRSTV